MAEHTARELANSRGFVTPAEAQFLTVREAAAHLRVSKSYLDKLRVYGGGPEFVRLGQRKILYSRSALDAWATSRRFNSTSQYPSRPSLDPKSFPSPSNNIQYKSKY